MSSSSELRFESKDEAIAYLDKLKSETGYKGIAGLDECGRGPLAGPVVAACVLLPLDHGIKGIKDSKKLSAKRREELASQIMEKGIWGLGVKSNEEVDKLNIRVATFQAAAEAAIQCMYSGAPIDFLLCDGGLFIDSMIPFPSVPVIKGDLWFESIGAASIIAKVYRDQQMAVYHDVWPEYDFQSNQGYGTKVHRDAIIKYGISPIHRRSYGICKKAQERLNESVQGDL